MTSYFGDECGAVSCVWRHVYQHYGINETEGSTRKGRKGREGKAGCIRELGPLASASSSQ